jgi:hypothetical protein
VAVASVAASAVGEEDAAPEAPGDICER